jgi:hypothetical protein
MAVELRDRVRDTITGYTGIVIGVTQWIHGCVRCTVQARELKDGRPVDPVCFDEPQLELLSAAAVPLPFAQTVAPTDAATRGGPLAAPARRPDVQR